MIQVNKSWQFAAIALMYAMPLAAAYAAEVETDVIGAGKAQIEVKGAFERDRSLDVRTRYTPLLARIGLSESLELRLATDGRIVSKSGGDTTRGWGDAGVALRLNTQAPDDDVGSVSTAWQLDVGVPTGSSAFRAASVGTALRFTAERVLTDTVSAGVQPLVSYQRNASGDWYAAPGIAVGIGKNWTPAFRGVAEIIAPQITSRANGGNIAALNLGATWRASEAVEFEVVYARGLTNNTTAHGLVAGVNLRF
jgi:hypothetical protein